MTLAVQSQHSLDTMQVLTQHTALKRRNTTIFAGYFLMGGEFIKKKIKIDFDPQCTHGFLKKKFEQFGPAVWPAITNIYFYVWI